MISIWIDILSNSIEYESCIPSQTDSSSVAGWLRKSNFVDSDNEIGQMTTAHHLAHLVIDSKCCLYSQWFPGDQNIVADALSRDFHLSNTNLANLITSLVPSQVPFGLIIQDLPKEISSWLTCLLLNQPFKEQWLKAPTRSKLSLGTDSKTTCYPSVAKEIPSSNSSHHLRNIKSSQPLLWENRRVAGCVEVCMLRSKLHSWTDFFLT